MVQFEESEMGNEETADFRRRCNADPRGSPSRIAIAG